MNNHEVNGVGGVFDQDLFDSSMPPNELELRTRELDSAGVFYAGRNNYQNDIEWSDDDVDPESFLFGGSRMNDDCGGDESDDEADSVQGEPGVENLRCPRPSYENHFIRIPGVGPVCLFAIFQGLSQHDWCTCHHGGLPLDSHLFERNVSSGTDSPSSTYPEPSSGERSLDCSVHLPPRTEPPTVMVALSGSEPRFQTTTVNYFTAAPMWLVPEQFRPHYPMELGTIEDEPGEDDP